MFYKNRKYDKKDIEMMDLVDDLSKLTNKIDLLEKKFNVLKVDNEILDGLLSSVLRYTNYSNLKFYIKFKRISFKTSMNYFNGFIGKSYDGGVVLSTKPIYFDNIHEAAKMYSKDFKEFKETEDEVFVFHLVGEYSKEPDQSIYRLKRTDDLGNKVYMYFEEDTNTPYYTSVESFALTASLEEIKKWKTPAWEIEVVN